MELSLNYHVIEQAIEQSFTAILITNSELDWPGPHILHVNHAMEQMTGYSREELIGENPRLLQGKETNREMLLSLRRALAAGEHFSAVTTNYRKDGCAYLVEWSISPVRSANEDITHFISVQRDITHQFKSQKTIEILSSGLKLTSDFVMITDVEGYIEYVNPAFEHHTGHNRKAIMGKNPRLLQSGRHTPQFYAHMWETLTNGDSFHDTFVDQTADGRVVHLEQTVTPIKDKQGRTIHYVSIGRNITKHVQKEEELERLADTDNLTGLLNRASFDRQLEDEIARCDRYLRPLSLIMIDIDFFKYINDTYGHHIGDKVLVEFANIISKNLRETDTCVRWGGEEFMILVPETKQNQAFQLADKLRRLIANMHFPYIDNITASFGVIEVGKDTAQESIKRVDRALYQAKESGRNRVVNG